MRIVASERSAQAFVVPQVQPSSGNVYPRVSPPQVLFGLTQGNNANATVNVKSKHGFRIIPFGSPAPAAVVSPASPGAYDRTARSEADYYSMCMPPTFPIYLAVNGAQGPRTICVRDSGWVEGDVDTIQFLPWGDQLMAVSYTPYCWSAYFMVLAADTQEEAQRSVVYKPRREDWAILLSGQGTGAAPTKGGGAGGKDNYDQGFFLWGHETKLRVQAVTNTATAAADTATPWVYIDPLMGWVAGAQLLGGFYGSVDQLLGEVGASVRKANLTAGGIAYDAPVGVYIQTGASGSGTGLQVAVGFDL